MRLLLAIWIGVSCVAITAHAAERRELGPHEHGHGRLDIAIEGNSVAMELEAPGMDLVGFEHPAETAAQETAFADAQRALLQPLDLFRVSDGAGCMVTAATVEIVSDEHDHDHDAEADDTAAEPDDHAEGMHNAFHASYTLKCDRPAELSEIGFTWFDRFPNSQAVAVTIIDDRGQRGFEIKRGDPPLAIGGTS